MATGPGGLGTKLEFQTKLGKVGATGMNSYEDNQCVQRSTFTTRLLSLYNAVLYNADSYASNQLVRYEDIEKKQSDTFTDVTATIYLLSPNDMTSAINTTGVGIGYVMNTQGYCILENIYYKIKYSDNVDHLTPCILNLCGNGLILQILDGMLTQDVAQNEIEDFIIDINTYSEGMIKLGESGQNPFEFSNFGGASGNVNQRIYFLDYNIITPNPYIYIDSANKIRYTFTVECNTNVTW